MTLQGVGQDACLNRGAVLESQCRDALHQFVAKTEIVKPGFPLARLDLELVDTPGSGILPAFTLAPATPAGFLLPGLRWPLVVFALRMTRGVTTLGTVACPGCGFLFCCLTTQAPDYTLDQNPFPVAVQKAR